MPTIDRRTVPPSVFLGELRTAELFVVSSLRLWVDSHCGGATGHPDWREGFLRTRISTIGALGFDTTCRIIATTALRTLDVRPLHCARVGDDELTFIRLFALLQRDQVLEAQSILGSWCPPCAVRFAITATQAFASALRARRLWLSPQQPECLALH